MPPLVQYLANAGLAINKIEILDASIAEDGPNDTYGGSVRQGRMMRSCDVVVSDRSMTCLLRLCSATTTIYVPSGLFYCL